GLVARRTRWELELTTGPRIEVRTGHYGRIRGRSFGLFVADEVAFWPDDESGSNPAATVLEAVRPALATLRGQLVCISSPYARSGPMWDAFKQSFGQDDPAVLVWRGTSLEMNPSLPERVVADALARDESAARAEWCAEFRDDVETFVRQEAVAACVPAGVTERPPLRDVDYVAFVDPSGGSADSMTLAVAPGEETEDGRRLPGLGGGWGRKPPFPP